MESLDNIFLNARVVHEPSERAAYLAQACGADAELRGRVEAMLGDAEAAEAYFGPEKETAAGHSNALVSEGPGVLIGRYKLLQKIGEGGMGVVYMAEQREPVTRKVALKIIKLGMDTRQVVARFEAERQALALMDHPNIARVLDGGATETGRPYFVMELVQGAPITEFCNKNKLPALERIKLFMAVCQAIQSAHQKGIIHRDLKPSNVLVTLHNSQPMPKVIDFGVAKATNQKLTEKTLFTNFATIIGTPAYMSPEQAEMSSMDVDTRSDIYSLGVLLYELLTGTTPFPEKRLCSAGYNEMRRIILEEEPERPSTRLTKTRAAASAADCAAKSALRISESAIDADLDWIVMKCLEKDRSRRYETASGLAADLQRHMNNQPVLARPPSAAYQLGKAFQRNRLAFTAVLAVAVALVLGIIGSSWQAIRAANAERVQNRLRHEAELARVQESHLRGQAERERQRAEDKELTARRYLYDSQIKLAHQALLENRLGRALELLNAQRPGPGQQDLRGWEWRYLWRACRSDELRTISRHSGPASAVAFSPDGQWIASGDESGILKICQASQPAEQREFSMGSIHDLAFSPDGEWLATAAESVVNLRPFRDPDKVSTLPHPRRVYAVAFSPDGLRLATVWGDQASIWNVASGKEISRFTPLAPRFTHELAFSPDNETLAIGLGHGQISLWNLSSNAPLGLLQGHRYIRGGNQVVTALSFSPDGALLVSGGWDKTIKVWNLPEGNLVADIPAHGAWVSDLAFSPDGKVLASVSADQTIKLWDTRTWQTAGTLRGHAQPISSVASAPDNKSLATSADDGAVKLWSVDQRSLPLDSFPLAGNGASMALSEDGGWLFAEYFDRSFLIVETATMKTNRYAYPLPNYFNGAVAPGGEIVALATHDGHVVIYGLRPTALEELARAKAHAGKINYLAFSRDAKLLVTAGEDKMIRLLQA
ncbi:MAG: protein kinase, partial [Verrucomicrobiales bacterium]|nr:protein kinase [Verrucomicrobiales bacterium]